MTFALLFPGQGARHVVEAWEFARTLGDGSLLQHALQAPGLTEDELLARGGQAFERTEVLQPTLTAISLVVLDALQLELHALRARAVLGHSLGEIAAVCAGGAFDARAAIALAATRGRLMSREAAAKPGGLVVVDSLDAAKAWPTLELAAVNAPTEVVLGGPAAALPSRLRRVPVSGAWHTSAMRGAVEEFRTALQHTAPKPLSIPLVRNSDGAQTREVDGLVEQLVKPVQFTAALDTLHALAVDTIVIVGPGHVMRSLVRAHPSARFRVLTTENADDLSATRAALGG